ncbi:hypothetical protein CATMIT_01764, partial [Catenibacterium mitsuokai DSM 15897]
LLHADLRHHRRGGVPARTGARAALGRGGGRLPRRTGDRAAGLDRILYRQPRRAGRGGARRGDLDPDQATVEDRFGQHHRAVHLCVLGADVAVAGVVRLAVAAGHRLGLDRRRRRVRHRRAGAMDACAQARRSLGADADQLRAAAAGVDRRLAVVQREPGPLHRDRRGDHSRLERLHRPSRGAAGAQARFGRGDSGGGAGGIGGCVVVVLARSRLAPLL